MSIAAMKRITICGLLSDREAIVSELQALGCVHLTPLRKPGPLEPVDARQRRRAHAAFRHLQDAPGNLKPWPARRTVDLDEVIEQALENKNRLRAERDKAEFLRARITAMQEFGDFGLPEDDVLRGRKAWFYKVPVKDRRALSDLELPWQIVGRDNTQLFVVVISATEPDASLLPTARIHTGSRRLSHLKEDLEDIEIEIERSETELAEIARARLILGARLAEAEDADDRRAAIGMSYADDRVFALRGWCPSHAEEKLAALGRQLSVAVVVEDPSPQDEPPTMLRNDGAFSGAGDLTSFYMTPSYQSWDPSLIVFASFCVFFAMIMADAGYAALLGLVVAWYWRRMGRTAEGQRLRVLGAVTLGTAFLYGVLAGSYFGMPPPSGSLLSTVAVIDVTDTSTMMKVSIVIGVLHISLANAVAAWRMRGTPDFMVKLGWIAVTIGGLVIWLTPGGLGLALVVAGLLAVFVGGALGRKVQTPRDWLLKLADGAMGLTSLTKLFGDVLSYMRLFALGLASASLAATFNGLAHQLSNDMPGAGVLLALLVLVVGHGVNLALAIMSGAVHGLRLNYIEFFGWGLSEEGYPFKAFERREKRI